MKKQETVTFFGKTYRVNGMVGRAASCPLYMVNDSWDNTWEAETTGPLDDILASAQGPTAQQAATKLERRVLKEFKKLAKVCGYEVQG